LANWLIAASRAGPVIRAVSRASARFLRRWAAWRGERRRRHDVRSVRLGDLSDGWLKDIGLTRDDVERNEPPRRWHP
jgi:uncharacterized protein YjiS (DUF1127 family)